MGKYRSDRNGGPSCFRKRPRLQEREGSAGLEVEWRVRLRDRRRRPPFPPSLRRIGMPVHSYCPDKPISWGGMGGTRIPQTLLVLAYLTKPKFCAPSNNSQGDTELSWVILMIR